MPAGESQDSLKTLPHSISTPSVFKRGTYTAPVYSHSELWISAVQTELTGQGPGLILTGTCILALELLKLNLSPVSKFRKKSSAEVCILSF